MRASVMVGKTIKDIFVDGHGMKIEFTNGMVFDYIATDGGYSCWGIYRSHKDYVKGVEMEDEE